MTPKWFDLAVKEIGQRELPENRGPVVRRYITLGKCGEEGDPWCAIFVNAMLEQAGVSGTRSPSSQSFTRHANFARLPGPAIGAIVVYWRIAKTSGLGHVGFYAGEDNHGFIDTVGGNESDMVRAEMYNPAGRTFGLRGFYWPKTDAKGVSIPLPKIAASLPIISTSTGTGKVV
jgi:uncharacterized protein (TIGR02594 family)